jgi:alpha-galactosidase
MVIDDSWSADARDEGSGLQAHKRKFPSGMGETARHIRELGLELGLYTTSGEYTCAGQQNHGGNRHRGSMNHQRDDVELWIREWGVTYIKVSKVHACMACVY